MKISKNKSAVAKVAAAKEVSTDKFNKKYKKAQEAIMDAITELTSIADADGGDEIAKDSIANLSVVLLDLQGGK